MATSPIPVGEILAGKYRIEKVLGAGGMGVVVAATHLELDQKVAIKFVLPSANDADALIRFTREARALAKVESEHVARVMDVGTLGDGTPYMVMEYLDGNDLARLVRERGPIPLGEAIEWMLEACDAVSAAHAAGIVHRDLKPANLFLMRRRHGRGVTIKVLDFGISKAFGSASQEELALTKTATVLGSPLYMAPEQIKESRDVDVRADVWALGVIFYELTTGSVPFNAESLPALIARITTDSPTPAHERLATLPMEVTTITARCLEKDPASRYASVEDLAAALRRMQKATASGDDDDVLVKPSTPSDAGRSVLAASVDFPSSEPPLFPSTTDRALARSVSEVRGSGESSTAGAPKRRAAALIVFAVVVGGGTALAVLAGVTEDPKKTPTSNNNNTVEPSLSASASASTSATIEPVTPTAPSSSSVLSAPKTASALPTTRPVVSAKPSSSPSKVEPVVDAAPPIRVTPEGPKPPPKGSLL